MGKRFLTLLALCALVPALLLGVLYLATRGEAEAAYKLTKEQSKPAVYDIVCISAGIPILRAQGFHIERGGNTLFWEDEAGEYSTNAECVVRRQKP